MDNATNEEQMQRRTFQEYLDDKKKVVEKPKAEMVPDYHGPQQNNPPFPGAKPYKGEANKPPTDKKEKSLGDEGDPKLKYEPKVGESKDMAHWTETSKWVNATKNMPMDEFLSQFKGKGIVGLDTVVETARRCKENNSLLNDLVRSMKREGLLESLVQEVFKHDESLKKIAHILESDIHSARRMVRAMNEAVGPPAHDEEMMGKPSDEDLKDPDMDELENDEEDEDEDEDDLGLDDEDMDDEDGDMGDMADLDMDDEDEDMDMDDQDMDDQDMDDEMPEDDMDSPMKQIKDHPMMRKSMNYY